MKKTTLLLMLFCFGFIHQAIAQERQIVQGYCKDENGKAIENVSVYAHDSLLIAITDSKGRFTYTHAKAGEILRFAHIVFEPTYYTIKKKDINGKNLNVKMNIRSHELLEVEITANAPHVAYDNPVMTVLDYVLRNGHAARNAHLFAIQNHQPRRFWRHLRPQRLPSQPNRIHGDGRRETDDNELLLFHAEERVL